MTGDQFVFGDTMPRAADFIVKEAVKVGTAEAFQAAHDKLHGITTFLIFMEDKQGLFTDAIVKLGNLRSRMRLLAERDDFREWALPKMRALRQL